ncbi:MAG: GTPase [Desulfurococcaceae archaeon]
MRTRRNNGIVLATWNELEKLVKKADVVLMVLDARDPLGTFSKRVENIVRRYRKELILVLNKADLIPRSVANEWKKYFIEKGYEVIYMAAKHHKGTLKLRKTIKRVAKRLPAVVLVVGYPKVGKSSIINALKGRHSASTSPYPGNPGYTKRPQLYRIDKNILMIDTPGVIPVEGDELEKVIRGFPPEKLRDPVNTALLLIDKITRYNPEAFYLAYGIEIRDPIKILEELAIKRGWFYKTTKEPLIEEAAKAIIRDYHDGKIPFYIKPSDIIYESARDNYDHKSENR